VSLLEHHLAMLEASAISDAAIDARGYFSADQKVKLEELGFARYQRIAPSLVLPSYGVHGQITTYQARPDRPRIDPERGREIKYETIAGSTTTLDVPPLARPLLGDPLRTLWITEGIKKGDALASQGLAVVTLFGVWNYAAGSDDWERVALEDRPVNVAFDSDVSVNPTVHAALERIGGFLASKGARVSFVYLPQGDGKLGVDDFIAGGGTVDELRELAEPKLRPRPTPPPEEQPKPAMPTGLLLAAIEQYLERFVRYPSTERHELAALALWTAHTWAIDAFDVTPYVYIRSAEKGSGKTRALETLHPIVRRPLRASSISAAAVHQAVEAKCPTLMIDEADAVFTSKSESAEALRGVLNGANRRGSPVLRGSQDGELREFEVFSPKALAGIDTGKLPETIRDRAIVVGLKKKLRSERVERFYLRDVEEQTAQAREQLERWAAENLEGLREYRTAPIPQISERLEEGWEPLLAIAELAGGDWPDRARDAAVALAKADLGGDVDHAHQLLAAIREVFAGSAMRSRELAAKVNELEEYGFGGWRDGKGIDARGVSSLLRRYGIKPKNVRTLLEGQGKGFERDQFADAWRRHLDTRDTDPGNRPSQPSHRPNGPHTLSQSEESWDGRGTDGGNGSVPGPSHPQTHSQSQTPALWDGGTDGTDENRPGVRAPSDEEHGEQRPDDGRRWIDPGVSL
jgi:hypothetical protein